MKKSRKQKKKLFKRRQSHKYKKGGSSTYTAIIIEPRKHKALEFVLKNILENLNNDWNVIVFHGNLNKEYIKNILNTTLNKYKDRITLKSLKKDNLSIEKYNTLLTTPSFYDNIPTELFLLFQTDSMINPRNKENINNFLKYDYVGAPWNDISTGVGNGGFSLRRKSKMLEIIKHCLPLNGPEDLFFAQTYKANCPNMSLNVPSEKEAEEFSSEQIWNPKSFGIHSPWKYLDNEKILKDFPEISELMELQGLEE